MRNKYGKLCFDCTDFGFTSDEKVLDIKTEDFLKMMPKQLSILVKKSNITLEIPLTNIFSVDAETISFAITINGDAADATFSIHLEEEYLYITAYEL